MLQYTYCDAGFQIYLRIHDDPASVAPPPLTNGALKAAAQAAEAAKKQEKIEAAKAKKAESAKDKGKKRAFVLHGSAPFLFCR